MSRRRKKKRSIIFALFTLPFLPVLILIRLLMECLTSTSRPGGSLFRRHRVKY